MAETREGTSAASTALERLRAGQPPEPKAADAPEGPAERAQSAPPAKSAAPQATIPPLPNRPPAARHMANTHTKFDYSGSPKRLSDFFDSLQQPDWAAARQRLSDALTRQRELAAERSGERAARRQARDRARRAREARERAAELERAELQRVEAERAEAERVARELAEAERAEADLRKRTQIEFAQRAAAAEAASAANLASLVESAKEAIDSSHTRPEPETDFAAEEVEELPERQPVWVEEADEEPIYIPPYNLPSTDPNPAENQQDLLRRTTVSVAAALILVLGFLGLGWFGGATAHSTPGSHFDPDFSLLSTGVDSFVLWGVVFVALGAFAAYQWHPSQRSSLRQRSLGYVAASSGLLGALWLLAARNGLVSTSLWIAAVTTAVLVYGLRLLNLRTARSRTERIFVDAPIGLYLGWMLVVAPMNLAVWLTSRGIDVVLPAGAWGVLAIVGATWAAVSFCMSERGRIVVALGFSWGLFWLMMARLIGPNHSAAVAIMAGLCAFITLLATENRRYQIGHAERRAARGQRTEF